MAKHAQQGLNALVTARKEMRNAIEQENKEYKGIIAALKVDLALFKAQGKTTSADLALDRLHQVQAERIEKLSELREARNSVMASVNAQGIETALEKFHAAVADVRLGKTTDVDANQSGQTNVSVITSLEHQITTEVTSAGPVVTPTSTLPEIEIYQDLFDGVKSSTSNASGTASTANEGSGVETEPASVTVTSDTEQPAAVDISTIDPSKVITSVTLFPEIEIPVGNVDSFASGEIVGSEAVAASKLSTGAEVGNAIENATVTSDTEQSAAVDISSIDPSKVITSVTIFPALNLSELYVPGCEFGGNTIGLVDMSVDGGLNASELFQSASPVASVLNLTDANLFPAPSGGEYGAWMVQHQAPIIALDFTVI